MCGRAGARTRGAALSVPGEAGLGFPTPPTRAPTHPPHTALHRLSLRPGARGKAPDSAPKLRERTRLRPHGLCVCPAGRSSPVCAPGSRLSFLEAQRWV